MITVFENRYVSVKNIYGTQNENNITELEIEVPQEYENWNKRIVFITDEGNKWDYISGNIYKLKNNITKYQEVGCYIWLTKNSEAEEESIDDFRSETFRLFFNKNEQADDTVPSEEQLDGFNTLINGLNVALDKVNNINSDVEKLKEEVTQTIEDLNTKVETGEFDGATFIPNVDAEGNISWTNDKGLPNPSTQNIKGEKGDPGKQGLQGIPGEKGEQGNPFQIKKTYPSKEAMDLDYPNMQYNDYVMIASNVNDEDNAKLYVKAEGETGWVFITDFSGAQGIQGEKGEKPVKGIDYFTEQDKQELVNEVTQDANSSFNQNVTAKTNEFNNNATDKTNSFNTNAETKTTQFNENANAKTEEFNQNAQNKIDEFNQNTEVFENRLTSLETNDTKQDELITKLKNNQFNLVEEGTSINVQDSSDLPAVLQVSGGERQDGEPTPDTPVEVEAVEGNIEINKVNKNWIDLDLLPYSEKSSDLNGTVVTEIEDGKLYIDATNTIDSGTVKSKSIYTKELILKKGKYISNVRLNTRTLKDDTFIQYNTSIVDVKEDSYILQWYKFLKKGEKIILSPQLELNSIQTDYTPHESEVYNLPIQQPMLNGDTFVKEDGNWVEVHGWKKYVFTGDENISYSSVNNVFYTDMFLDKLKGRINFISNSFKVTDTTNYLNMENYSATGSSDSVRIIFKYTELTSIDQFKQFLKEKYNSGNSVYVWYQLATPTKLPCTPEQVEVLEQLYNMPTYRPVTNIFTKEDLANLKLNYVADSKIYVDNKINAMQANLNTINQLLSTTATSALLLNNMQTDLESEVI